MATTFQQFSTACKHEFPASMFCHDSNLGTIGIDVKIVAAFFKWLRHKGQGADAKKNRKVSTLQNYWLHTKSGLKHGLARDTIKPEWLSCSPGKYTILNRMLSAWAKEDLQNMPVKSFLLEDHIEEFSLKSLWYHMQACPPHICLGCIRPKHFLCALFLLSLVHEESQEEHIVLIR